MCVHVFVYVCTCMCVSVVWRGNPRVGGADSEVWAWHQCGKTNALLIFISTITIKRTGRVGERGERRGREGRGRWRREGGGEDTGCYLC